MNMNSEIALDKAALGRYSNALIEKLAKFMLLNSLKINSIPRR